MMEDANGDLWISTLSKKIYSYSTKEQSLTSYPSLNRSTGMWHFFKSPHDVISVVNEKEIFHYDPSTKRFVKADFTIPDSLRLIAIDSYGNYWFFPREISNGLPLYVKKGNDFKIALQIGGNDEINFCRSFRFAKNNTWIAPAFGGVSQYRFDSASSQLHLVKKFLPEGVDVYDIFEDDDGIVWLGTYDDGLIRLDPSTGKFKSFTREQGMISNFILKLIPSGNKLLAVTDLGTVYFDKRSLQVMYNKNLKDYLLFETAASTPKFMGNNLYEDYALPLQNRQVAVINREGIALFNAGDFKTDTSRPALQVANLLVGERVMNDKILTGKPIRLKYYQNDLYI
jgi:ligand-binding sensor domain-containing protein